MSGPVTTVAGVTSPDAPGAAGPFAALADFAALPRVTGLALSPDARRLAVSVQTLDADGKKWVSALWEVDPDGQRPGSCLGRSTIAPARPPAGRGPTTSTSRPDAPGSRCRW